MALTECYRSVRTLAILFTLATAGCVTSAPGFRGPVSEHFDGERFHNLAPFKDKGFFDVADAFLFEEGGDWDERAIENSVPDARVPGGLRVTFINHSTTLIQLDGINILTDPIYSNRASPLSWAGPSRYHSPGVAFEDLPPIDVVVVSHNHYDHLDISTLGRLQERDSPLIVAGLGTEALLAEEEITGGHDLDWWKSVKVGPLTIHAVPAQHWSRRGFGDTRNTLWAGYFIEGPSGRVYFAGDTAWGPHFDSIRERFAPPDLALLPVGAFEPRWFMRSSHVSPEETADAAFVLNARVSVPIHWGTFDLGLDGPHEGLRVLHRYLDLMDEPPKFHVLKPGESLQVVGEG
ncbi:MAG: MBL fold metallo-hydrolase [Myxococcota bacterium]